MDNTVQIILIMAFSSGLSFVAARAMVRSVRYLADKTEGTIRNLLFQFVWLIMSAIVCLPGLYVLFVLMVSTHKGDHSIVYIWVPIFLVAAFPAFWYLFKNRNDLYDAGYWKRKSN